MECGVDLYQFSKEELRRAMREASVQQVLVNAPVGTFSPSAECEGAAWRTAPVSAAPPTAAGEGNLGKWGLAAVPGLEDAFRDSVATALEYAGALDCPRVHFMAGCPTGEGSVDVCQRTFVSNLALAASECAKVGHLSHCLSCS